MKKGIIPLLIIAAILLVPALTASSNYTCIASVINKYGPVVIYSENSVIIYAFDEGFFNYTYRNVYVYITSNYIIEGEDRIPELYNITYKYLPVNPYELNLSTAKADTWREEQIANLFNEKTGYPIVKGVGEYDGTILIVIANTNAGLDELVAIGREVSGKYNGKVEIIEMSPFEGFFNGEYNESLIASEAKKIVEENGLTSVVTGIGGWIPAFRIYAILELDSDALKAIAESKHVNATKLIQDIIDKLRERIPEEIPLSIIVKKKGEVKFLENYGKNEIDITPPNYGALQWIIVTVPVIALPPAVYWWFSKRR